ncbi:YggT family protein [Paenibacillus sp. KS-LC4]|uniref:YggT family protein n=1 Tax=Paenibacillus sp. KS-LC4 TaxID=2979727 RepID=UPI0030D148AE
MNLQSIYSFMIIGYVLLSWLPNARESFIGVFLGKLVEPYLGIFRRFIPPIGGMIDISPIVAIFALRFVAMGLIAVVGFILPG